METRICTKCGKEMTEGYILNEAVEYYCSDECLYQEITEQEYLELYNQDCAYWTQW